MKINIRRSTFETNSSSMHSLVILKDDKKPEIEDYVYVGNDNTWNIWSEDDLVFERGPFDILSTPTDKFKYLLAAFGKERKNELIEAIKSIYPEIKKIKFPKDWKDKTFYGYIDHQSIGLVKNYIEENNIPLVEFLKDSKYQIIIDGDEYGIWNKMKESGLVDTESIVVDINCYSKDKNEPDFDDEER